MWSRLGLDGGLLTLPEARDNEAHSGNCGTRIDQRDQPRKGRHNVAQHASCFPRAPALSYVSFASPALSR